MSANFKKEIRQRIAANEIIELTVAAGLLAKQNVP